MLNMHIRFLRILWALEHALNNAEANNKYFHSVAFFLGWNYTRTIAIDLNMIGEHVVFHKPQKNNS